MKKKYYAYTNFRYFDHTEYVVAVFGKENNFDLINNFDKKTFFTNRKEVKKAIREICKEVVVYKEKDFKIVEIDFEGLEKIIN